MKSKVWARVTAVMLCMVLMLSTGITALAETGPAAQEQTAEQERKTEQTKNRTENDTAESSDKQETEKIQQQSEEQMTASGPEETEKPKEEQTDPSQTVPEKENTAETETKEETQESEQKTLELQKEETKAPESEAGTEQSEKEIRLEEQTGEYNVVLTGPASSFPEGTELSLSVSQIDKKVEDMVETAVEEKAKEQDYAVEKYTAFDIRLFSNGEEIQPSGPVHVTFHKRSRDKAEDALETKVYHVDEKTGTAEDMEAQEVKEGQVGIETTHFSIYVLVDLEQLDGKIQLTVQHWAEVEELKDVDGTEGLINPSQPNGVREDATAKLNSETMFQEIYSNDVIELDNNLKKDVLELSKVILADVDKQIKNYELKEVWLLNEGGNSESKEKNEWTVYDVTGTENETTIDLTKNSVIRFVYKPSQNSDALEQDVTFYDYNVTDGENPTWNSEGNFYVLNTDDKGINSAENYERQGDTTNRIAVGQHSAWVNHSYHNAKTPNQVLLNWAGDGAGNIAKKGIVLGISKEGPTYNGVYDAGLFNDDEKTGKKILDGYKLCFNQKGDTYTLSSVKKGNDSVLKGLDQLKDIYDVIDEKGVGKQIFSNNFWPLDGVENYSGKDPLFGAENGVDYASYVDNDDGKGAGYRRLADSDDGKAHNWFFGMRYSFEFTLGDYTGPLNFYFRGDDDFWLFVDGELVTDLGGIHSAVGENLDFSKCINLEDKTTTHRIEIVYAERGGFGSTCYMQFTLPNVKPVEFDTEVEKTSITVEKKWQDHNNPNRPSSINVELWYKKESDSDTTTAWKKHSEIATLTASNNWTYTWSGLPKDGYIYKVKEVGEEDGQNGKYKVTYQSGTYTDGTLNQNKDETFSGTITNTLNPYTWITVNKVWKNDSVETRPEQVDFYLYYRPVGVEQWTPYPDGRLRLTSENVLQESRSTWTGKYDNLPVYEGDSDTLLEYTVMEVNDATPLKPGDSLPGENGAQYTVSYQDGHFDKYGAWKAYRAIPSDETMNLTVTNYLPKPWQIIKRSSTSDNLTLPEAKFALTNTKKPGETYIGTSGQEGIVTWVDSGGKEVTSFPDGEYRLEETEAPIGYYLSEEIWTLTITEGVPTMSKSGSEGIDQGQIGDQTDTVIFYYKNTPMYALPSSGGVGIYPFIGGGTALMLMGVFLMHRSRKRKLKG